MLMYTWEDWSGTMMLFSRHECQDNDCTDTNNNDSFVTEDQRVPYGPLTLSSPVVSNGYTSKCLGPYWSKPPFLIFWHSGTGAQSWAPDWPECQNIQKLKGWIRPVWRWMPWWTHFCRNQKKTWYWKVNVIAYTVKAAFHQSN